jgi:hypothetical protein
MPAIFLLAGLLFWLVCGAVQLWDLLVSLLERRR